MFARAPTPTCICGIRTKMTTVDHTLMITAPDGRKRRRRGEPRNRLTVSAIVHCASHSSHLTRRARRPVTGLRQRRRLGRSAATTGHWRGTWGAELRAVARRPIPGRARISGRRRSAVRRRPSGRVDTAIAVRVAAP